MRSGRGRGLLTRARRLGLRPVAIAFHVGSQQLDPQRGILGYVVVPTFSNSLGRVGGQRRGGFPVPYATVAPQLPVLADAITSALTRYFGADRPGSW
ncbi:pyridoxal-dependent decarboxylase, pyridoxal binding domain protein [Mycobacterium kansasii]|uniref:Pyridoxal-dependent decarboxylase, pyridoxal binding domain protein n=1 Tax=Mycobacterium kansasii TaxID=1768 RepID=A0A1V3X814_MYCKA|nr:pyridoxal-dependent decarboxylase, pyridoxal binding domain protein [Mycobacterium kansasii]